MSMKPVYETDGGILIDAKPIEDSDYWCRRFAALVVSLDESRTAAENQRDALADALEDAVRAFRGMGVDFPAEYTEALRAAGRLP